MYFYPRNIQLTALMTSSEHNFQPKKIKIVYLFNLFLWKWRSFPSNQKFMLKIKISIGNDQVAWKKKNSTTPNSEREGEQ
jgi:hypothetical protein